MELPIGLVLKESGVKLPKTHLVDPHAALRSMRRARWTLPLLVRKEKKLRKKLAGARKAAPRKEWSPQDLAARSNSNLEVY